ENNYYDVIIVGTGISGLFTALNIDSDKRVLMISKGEIGQGSSELAQGGIVSCINKEQHLIDTINAGNNYNDRAAVKTLGDESEENIKKLINLGVEFDKDSDGELCYTLEGGHSIATILHCKDITGKKIIDVLKRRVIESENIFLRGNTYVADIICEGDIKKIVALDHNINYFYSESVVIATGGVGQIYNNTTNSGDITGDGIAIASRMGLDICDMEFIQFHPTAMYEEGNNRKFLISEALRGEGGILRNINGERFMEKYHHMKELAPRDIVSRAIFTELSKSNSKYVYLDITHRDKEFLKMRFPNIYEKCLNKGIDISKDYIRVAPAQHYIMGGIKTDIRGKTKIPGIFACGECARTGVHGANRLASNSLLEGIVFGKIIAGEINKDKAMKDINITYNDVGIYKNITNNKNENEKYQEIRECLRETMEKYVSVIRSEDSLNKALLIIDKLKNELVNNFYVSKDYFETLNIVTIGELIVNASIKRKESLGAYYRID
ncbi:MAG: L-aspartate oxidase, partial [Clostridium sp.]